jgi:hypothetical protein
MARERTKEQDDFAELEAGLHIDENGLDDALMEQTELFYRVSKEYSLLVSRRDAAKQNVDEVKAEVDLQYRQDARNENEKVTEKEIEAKVRMDKDVVAAIDAHLKLNRAVGVYGALKEAYQQRNYVLKELSGLYVANYYGDVTHSSAKSAMLERRGDQARRAMNEARRGAK